MNGRVDSAKRALLDIPIRLEFNQLPKMITAWIDTAFNGQLVIPQELIDQLGLNQEAVTEAVLADGRQVTLKSYRCHIDWFGECVAIQVIANNGQYPLLGTELLSNRKLEIDYVLGMIHLH